MLQVIFSNNDAKEHIVQARVSEEALRTGMAGVSRKEYTNGMMFFLSNPGVHTFWLRGCIIPLDIIFISEQQQVTHVFHNCPPDDGIKSYEAHGMYVIELIGETAKKCGIEPGQNVTFREVDAKCISLGGGWNTQEYTPLLNKLRF